MRVMIIIISTSMVFMSETTITRCVVDTFDSTQSFEYLLDSCIFHNVTNVNIVIGSF